MHGFRLVLHRLRERSAGPHAVGWCLHQTTLLPATLADHHSYRAHRVGCPVHRLFRPDLPLLSRSIALVLDRCWTHRQRRHPLQPVHLLLVHGLRLLPTVLQRGQLPIRHAVPKRGPPGLIFKTKRPPHRRALTSAPRSSFS